MRLSVEEQLKIAREGAEDILPIEDLEVKLRRSGKEKRPLRIKLGLDPTAPDIHLGHTVVLRKLRQFQDLGHLAILIIGDFTAMIGDPSGRSEIRKSLTVEEIAINAQTYQEQAFKILDPSPKKIKIVYNSEWLKKMGMADVLRLTSSYTVARMLERDDFFTRYKKGQSISIAEFLYPLLQGMDSIAIEADVELGGTDQKFNLLIGRELQRAYGQEPQVILTMPLLEGIDGTQKMSKSLGNYIGVDEPPEEIFGKIMSIPDELMIKYFRLLTDISWSEIDSMEKDLAEDKLHPAQLKRRLGHNIVAMYHNKKAAERAAREFDLVFKEKEPPSEVPEFVLSPELLKDGRIWIVKLLTCIGFARTNSEARRLIEQRGVRLNNEVISSSEVDVKISDGDILQVGKRKFARLRT